jgi:hypothetical protein
MSIINTTPFAQTGMIDALKGAADIIEEVSDTLIYFGFCQPGTTNTNESKWAIMKIVVSGSIQPITTQFLWAGGMCSYNYSWDSRAGLTYTFKNF